MKFLQKLRNKLFLNAFRSITEDSRRQILDAVIAKQDDTIRILSERQRLLAETQSLLSEKQDASMEKLSETEKSLKSYYDKKVLKIGENTSKFISAAMLNREAFRPFRNYCKGKKLVVCGAGPSLQDYVPVPGAVHIALNRAFIFDKVQFDFVFAQDYEGVAMLRDELRDYRKGKCVKLFGKLFRDGEALKTNFPESYISECGAITFATDAFYPEDLFYNHPFIAEIDSRAISCGTNVGLCVMQFALWMNPDEIYIVGCDHSGGHFTTKGLSENLSKADCELSMATWKNNLKPARRQWKQLRTFAQIYYPDTKIISINPVGLRGIFTDWDQVTGKITENEAPPLTSLLDAFNYEESECTDPPGYPLSEEKCPFNVDKKEKQEGMLRIYGWAYKDDDEVDVYAKIGGRIYKSQKVERGDVKAAFDLCEGNKGFAFNLPCSEDEKITLYFVNRTEEVIYQADI